MKTRYYPATVLPHERLPVHPLEDAGAPMPAEGYQDRDNFVRNLVTMLLPGGGAALPVERTTSVSPLSGSAAALAAVVTLPQIKMHLRIDPDQTAEDEYLLQLEMAARIHTGNVIRRDLDDTVGENVKQAILLLLAHWYRNRESISAGARSVSIVPHAYDALLAPERDYPCY